MVIILPCAHVYAPFLAVGGALEAYMYSRAPGPPTSTSYIYYCAHTKGQGFSRDKSVSREKRIQFFLEKNLEKK